MLAPAEGPVAAQVQVLVVDDHELTRRHLAAALDRHPELAVTGQASSGEEAVRLAVRLAPDVVVMDIRMPPGLDGLQATRRIRGSTRAAVVLVSGYEDELYAAAASEVGAARCIAKSVSEAELAAAVLQAADSDHAGHGV